jgi:hypothetical protein
VSGPQAAQILRLLKPFCNPSGEKSDITEAMEMGATALEAAPELLAALESLVGAAEDGDGISDRDWKRVEKLIANAKGESA